MTTRYPYPCVRVRSRVGGYAAYYPHGQAPTPRYLATFDTAEEARAAVLHAQASHLEAKAARYRAEADALIVLSGLPDGRMET